MARLEQSTVPARSKAEDATRERDDVVIAERNGMMPLVALAIALAFGASAWFFYHQGKNDASLASTSPPASTTDDSATNGQTSLAETTTDPATTTTAVQSASYGNPDIIVTVHPNAAQTQAQAQAPAAKRMLAKANKPARLAPTVASAPIDRQVALTTRPQPVYPSQALRAREQGTVLVMAQVDINGHVSDTRVVRRSGSNTLDRAAPNEVRRWKFEPALHDGRPIVASVEVPVSYRLDQ